MKGYLHTEKTADGEAGFIRTRDVAVDFPQGTNFSPNVRIQVEILEGNDDRVEEAFVVPKYPLFGSVYNSDLLGAEILQPQINPAGEYLKAGRKLVIRLIPDC